jgi:hypothetical protein
MSEANTGHTALSLQRTAAAIAARWCRHLRGRAKARGPVARPPLRSAASGLLTLLRVDCKEAGKLSRRRGHE